jgi:hypothetical protein
MATTPRIKANRLNLIEPFPMEASYGAKPGVFKPAASVLGPCSLLRNAL